MANYLVFVEANESGVKRHGLELLSALQKAQAPFSAVILGPHTEPAKASIQKYGAEKIYWQSKGYDDYNPETFAKALQEAVEKEEPKVILASNTALGKDLFPRVAARFNATIASDCTELALENEDVVVRRPFFAGKCDAKAVFKGGAQRFVLMRPNQLTVEEATSNASSEEIELTHPPQDLKTVIKEVVQGASKKLDLTEANIIVSGGRGIVSDNKFHMEMLESLAEVLGASVGASRTVVDDGHVPHSMQVGQTGKTVSPSLYIAVGISGAIQHIAGMSTSKVIVAINKDADAPIFKKATYGIVGDAFEVVPKLTEEFKRVLQ